jgi:hypothetical protein
VNKASYTHNHDNLQPSSYKFFPSRYFRVLANLHRSIPWSPSNSRTTLDYSPLQISIPPWTTNSTSNMHFPSLFTLLFTTPYLALAIPLSSTTLTTSTSTTCTPPSPSLCAQFLFPNGTVSQDINLQDGGCTDVAHPKEVAGIRVYGCWCGIWK